MSCSACDRAEKRSWKTVGGQPCEWAGRRAAGEAHLHALLLAPNQNVALQTVVPVVAAVRLATRMVLGGEGAGPAESTTAPRRSAARGTRHAAPAHLQHRSNDVVDVVAKAVGTRALAARDIHPVFCEPARGIWRK